MLCQFTTTAYAAPTQSTLLITSYTGDEECTLMSLVEHTNTECSNTSYMYIHGYNHPYISNSEISVLTGVLCYGCAKQVLCYGVTFSVCVLCQPLHSCFFFVVRAF